MAKKTVLTNGKAAIDKATNLADIENAKSAAITAIQEAQATEHKDPKSPETGDTSNRTLWVMLMALSSKRRYDYDNGNKRCKLLYHDEKVNTSAQRQGENPCRCLHIYSITINKYKTGEKIIH